MINIVESFFMFCRIRQRCNLFTSFSYHCVLISVTACIVHCFFSARNFLLTLQINHQGLTEFNATFTRATLLLTDSKIFTHKNLSCRVVTGTRIQARLACRDASGKNCRRVLVTPAVSDADYILRDSMQESFSVYFR